MSVNCTSREPREEHSWCWNPQGTAALCTKCDRIPPMNVSSDLALGSHGNAYITPIKPTASVPSTAPVPSTASTSLTNTMHPEFIQPLRTELRTSAVMYLENRVNDLLSKLQSNNVKVQPSFVMAQTTGSGKTRAALELQKKMFCVYLPCGTTAGGFETVSAVRHLTHYNENKYGEELINKAALSFVVSVVETAKKYDSAEQLRLSQITNLGALNNEFYDQLDSEFMNLMESVSDEKTPTPAKLIPYLDLLRYEKEKDRKHEGEINVNVERAVHPTSQSLVIICDEFQSLDDDIATKTSIGRSLLRAVEMINMCHEKYSAVKFRLAVVLMSTTSKVGDIMPVSTSSRRTVRSINPPLYDFEVYNIFDDFKDESLTPGVLHMMRQFMVGRPMWGSLLIKYLAEGLPGLEAIDRLLKFVTDKLDTKPSGRQKDTSRMASLIACRLCFAPIHNDEAEHFINFRMAHLVRVDEKQLVALYHPEPILWEAAARSITAGVDKEERMIEAIKAVGRCINFSRLIRSDCGDAGEFAACCALLLTMDAIRVKKLNYSKCQTMSSGISATEFLKSVGRLNSSQVGLFNDYEVNFNGFVRLGTFAGLGDKFLESLYDKSCAVIMPPNYEGKDMLIVMKDKKRNKFAPIFVQVKNWKSRIALKAVGDLCEHISSLPPEFPAFINTPWVCLLIATGDGGCAEVAQSTKNRMFLSVSLSNEEHFTELSAPVQNEISDLCKKYQDLDLSNRLSLGSLGVMIENGLNEVKSKKAVTEVDTKGSKKRNVSFDVDSEASMKGESANVEKSDNKNDNRNNRNRNRNRGNNNNNNSNNSNNNNTSSSATPQQKLSDRQKRLLKGVSVVSVVTSDSKLASSLAGLKIDPKGSVVTTTGGKSGGGPTASNKSSDKTDKPAAAVEVVSPTSTPDTASATAAAPPAVPKRAKRTTGTAAVVVPGSGSEGAASVSSPTAASIPPPPGISSPTSAPKSSGLPAGL